MNSKKSMRIFLITFALLAVSGSLILFVVHRHAKEDRPSQMEDRFLAQEAEPEQPDQETLDSARSTKKDLAMHHETEGALTQTNARPTNYQYELRVEEGYLDVYKWDSDQVYFHTGISFQTLDEENQNELQAGKFFSNEEELYGYLESCTS